MTDTVAKNSPLKSAAVAMIAALVVNGLIYGLGLNGQDDTFDRVWFAPPGWLVGCVWMVLYAFYGVAFAKARDTSARYWIVGLGVWGLLYPVTSGGFQPYMGQLSNIVSWLFSLFVYIRVSRIAPAAARWLIPSLMWISFACVWGMVAFGQR